MSLNISEGAMNDPSALVLAAEAADLDRAHPADHERTPHEQEDASGLPPDAADAGADGRTGARRRELELADPNVDAQCPLVASTGAGSAGRPARAPAPHGRAGGPPNPAETREDCEGENTPARPLCSRCEERPVAHGNLCAYCDELLACMANEIERGGEDWWAGS